MPSKDRSGRSLVSRRAVLDIVRAATLGSYGVTGFAANPLERLAGSLRLAQPGVRLEIRGGLAVDRGLTVAHRLPVAEVARRVDSGVRYAVRRSLDRDIDRLLIPVDGLRVRGATVPHRGGQRSGDISLAELAESGTDVAP